MTISAHDLSPRQLQYVVAVAETLGFHKAAERCHVSQPTLSAQVKQLEDVLGVQLFERDRRRVLLTAAGAVVVAHARRVLLEIDDMIAAAKQLVEPCSGTFRIGVIPPFALGTRSCGSSSARRRRTRSSPTCAKGGSTRACSRSRRRASSVRAGGS